MKKALSLALLVLAAPALAAASPMSAALDARGDQFVAAWNRHDVQGMAAVWAPDGDLINPVGRVARGRAEVEKLLADEHSTILKETTFKMLERSTHVLDGDVAIQDWTVEISGMQGPDGPMPPLQHHITVVFQKKAGQWWVAAARPVVYQQPPAAPKT